LQTAIFRKNLTFSVNRYVLLKKKTMLLSFVIHVSGIFQGSYFLLQLQGLIFTFPSGTLMYSNQNSSKARIIIIINLAPLPYYLPQKFSALSSFKYHD